MKPTHLSLEFTELESRTNPSAITFTQGHLVVNGTAAADSIHVYYYGNDATRVAVVMQTGDNRPVEDCANCPDSVDRDQRRRRQRLHCQRYELADLDRGGQGQRFRLGRFRQRHNPGRRRQRCARRTRLATIRLMAAPAMIPLSVKPGMIR